MLNLDDSEIDLQCPQCAKTFTKSLGWLKANDNLLCDCGITIVFDKKEFTGPISEAQKSLDNLEKQFLAFGRDITIKI